jgi:hypothetical protein
MSAQHYDDQPARVDDFTQARPFVLQDVGPDGQPQAMLVTPSTETIVDRDTARSLISELLLVLTPGCTAGGIAAALLFVAHIATAVGDCASTFS